MKRREFITLIGSAAAALPLGAQAQHSDQMRHVGVLMNVSEDDPEGRARVAAFVQGLEQLGWRQEDNFRIDVRWGGYDADRIRR